MKVRPDQNKYSFDIPTNKYGYTKEEWSEMSASYQSIVMRYHKKGITRETLFKRKEELVKIASSIDIRDDFSSEYWENHPYNCENFVVLDGCLTPFGWAGHCCEMCYYEKDDPYYLGRD